MSRGIAQGKARGKLRTDFGDGPLRGTWRQPRFAWRKVQPLDVINFLFRQLMQFSLPGGWVKGKSSAFRGENHRLRCDFAYRATGSTDLGRSPLPSSLSRSLARFTLAKIH